MGKIISGFSNIGKSSLMKSKSVNCIDLDTCYFNKIDGWVDIYIECILALQNKYDYVLITTYGDVLKKLNKMNIEYTLIYPEKSLKLEYKKRCIDRKSDADFINGFFSRWEQHIDDCENNPNKNKIILKSNQYLSDVIGLIRGDDNGK